MVVDSVTVFFSYSHKDEELRNALDVHMAPLRRGKLISSWHDRKIGAGTEWDAAINDQLQAADIIVLLLSPDFLASDYCNDKEIPAALARHESGQAVVIPVVLRPFNWFNSPVAHLQSIPRDKKAVTTWADRDQAFVNVADGIREEATRVLELRRQQNLQRDAARERYQTKVLEMLSDGRVSLVERETLDELRDELKLTPAEAEAIEAKAAEPLKKYDEDLERYRRTLLKVIDEEYPIGAQMREDLKLRRRDLGLKDEDADRVEAPILAQAEARHQERLAAPPAPPPPPPPPAPAPVAVARPAQPAPVPAPAQAVTAPRPSRADEGDLVAAVLARADKHDDLHLAPNIPAKKLANAAKYCELPADDEALGLVDTTVFGSATDAVIIGRKGMYYRYFAGEPATFALRWADWAAGDGADFRADDANIVTPGGVSLCVAPFPSELLAKILNQIRAGL